MTREPKKTGRTAKTNQVLRLEALARRTEWLWELVGKRLALSEAAVRRHIDVWGAEELPTATGPKNATRYSETSRNLAPPTGDSRQSWTSGAPCGSGPSTASMSSSALQRTTNPHHAEPIQAQADLEPPPAQDGPAIPEIYISDSLFGDDPGEQLTIALNPSGRPAP